MHCGDEGVASTRGRREMIGLAHSSETRCHWLPYLKEMRRAEKGGIGRETRRVKRERKKGNVISRGDCPKVSPSFK